MEVRIQVSGDGGGYGCVVVCEGATDGRPLVAEALRACADAVASGTADDDVWLLR